MNVRRFTEMFSDDRRGSVAIVFALTSIGLFGIIGLAVDYGRAMSTQARIRGALDSAVLASSNVEGLDAQVEAATKFFQANFVDGFATGTTVPQFVRNSSGGLSGTVTAFVDTTFGKIVGVENLAVMVTASAKPTTQSTETHTVTNSTYIPGSFPCIHVEDQNNTSFKAISNSNVIMKDCEVHVRSNSSSAMSSVSNSNVKFKRVLIKGGAASAGGITVVASPYVIQTNAQVVGNPYSADVNDIIRMIDVGACTAANTDKSFSGGTVQPGTYCGTTTFNGVTFAPGLYIINDAQGNKNGVLKLNGSLDGSQGVSFYLAGNRTTFGQYNAAEGSELKAPTSGLSQGLLFFENSNRGINYALTISSVNKQSWTGVIYLPSINLTLDSLSEWPKFNVGMAINQLTMRSLSSIINPYAWTPYGKSASVTLPGETVTTTSTETSTSERSKFLLQ